MEMSHKFHLFLIITRELILRIYTQAHSRGGGGALGAYAPPPPPPYKPKGPIFSERSTFSEERTEQYLKSHNINSAKLV